jgi:general secretion pathway protein K
MTPTIFRRSQPAAGGFILIAVLWIIAALATLAVIYSNYAVNTAAASHVADDRLQSEASIRAGVELAAFQLLAAPAETRPTHGAFEVRVGRTKVAVRYRSERARIDLNAAPKELLAGLFAAIGVNEAQAADHVDHIIAWRTKPKPDVENTEASAYKTAGLAYPPRQAPFNDPLELSLVLGLSPAVAERILPDVTVFSGTAKVDVVSADAEVLAALPHMTPEILQKVLDARAAAPQDGQRLLTALGPAREGADIKSGVSFRAEIEVDLGRGRRVEGEVVFQLNDGDEAPYDVLYWRDDFDDPFQPGKQRRT